MQKFIAQATALAAIFSMSNLDAQNGIFQLDAHNYRHQSLEFEYVTLCDDYSCYQNFLHSVNTMDGAGAPQVMINNGSTWEMILDQETDPVAAATELRCWHKCDWLVFSPPKCPGDTHFYIKNMSRGSDPIPFRMVMGPMEMPEMGPMLSMELVEPLPEGRFHVLLSDGTDWYFNDDSKAMLEEWMTGDPVIIDVVQEFDFHAGTLMIREKAMMININHLNFALAE